MITLSDQILLSNILTLDYRETNLVITGNNIKVETILEYLSRVKVSERPLGLEVYVCAPSGTYSIDTFYTKIQSGEITYNKYRFFTTSDSGFILVENSGDMVLNLEQLVTGLKKFNNNKLALKGNSTGLILFKSNNDTNTDVLVEFPNKSGIVALLDDIPSLSSQNKNLFFASPKNISGLPSFRMIEEEDLPSINVSKLVGVLGGDKGGTGVNNANKLITLGGNLTLSGTYNTVLRVIDNTDITLPKTGTLVTLNGTEVLTNKTINKVLLLNNNVTNKTLEVIDDAKISGENTGDETKDSIIEKLTYTPANVAGDIFTGNVIVPNIKITTNAGVDKFAKSDANGNLVWTSIDELKKVYSITLPVNTTVLGRINGAISGTDYPSTWTLELGLSEYDLKINHNLNKKVASVNVFSIDSSGNERVLVPYSSAYTGWFYYAGFNSLAIEGLSTKETKLRISIIFE